MCRTNVKSLFKYAPNNYARSVNELLYIITVRKNSMELNLPSDQPELAARTILLLPKELSPRFT